MTEHRPTLLVHLHLELTDAERESLALASVGWCHVCSRDIEKVSDHAPGCSASDRGPTHPEVTMYSRLACEIAEVALGEGRAVEVIDCEEL